MALIDEARMALRLSMTALDEEISLLIDAAVADLGIAGVEGDTVTVDTDDPLIRRAVITYVRANFGEPADYAQMKASYDEQKAQLQVASGYTEWGAADE